MRPRSFAARLWLLVLLGLALRVAYALWKGDQGLLGDALFYRIQSEALADGHGFVVSGLYAFGGRILASAEHPPLFTSYLAAPQLVGWHGVTALRLWTTLLGVPTVLAAGAAGRELAGPRAGLLAAALVAVSPALVMTDGLVMSESITATTVALTIWLAARALRKPSVANLAWFGVGAALAALARGGELALLLPIVLIAVLLRRSDVPAKRRLGRVAIGLGAAVLVMAPWLVRNLTSFENPVLLSDGWDLAVLGANCPSTYSGPMIGTIDLYCGTAVHEGSDQSVAFARARRAGLRYARDHTDRWIPVAFARVGRTFGFFNVGQQINFDHDFESRERLISTIALAVWWASVAVGIVGMVALRRRGVSTVPLLAPVVVIAVAVLVTFGNTRLRVPADVAMLIAAGVGIDALLAGVTAARARAGLPGSRDGVGRARSARGDQTTQVAQLLGL